MTTQQVRPTADLVLRVLVAAGLAVDAYVHADLAPAYDGVRASVSQGGLFRIEAGLAAAATLIVLVVARRTGFGLAFAAAVSALGALLLYRYVDVGRLGPLPNMHEPSWFAEKTVAAVAEAVATAAALTGLLYVRRHRAAAGTGRGRPALTMAGGAVAGIAVAGFTGQGAGTPAAQVGSAAAGSGTAGQTAAGGQQVTIVGNNALRFAPMTLRLHTGKVRITLQDSGAYPHNIVIPALHVTFAHPGRYPFTCQYHASAGMTGVFVVS